MAEKITDWGWSRDAQMFDTWYRPLTVDVVWIDVTVGAKGRTTGAPISAHRLILDKLQDRSKILTK